MRLLYALDTLLGLLLTASAALFCAITLHRSSLKFALPLAFVGFVLLVAYRFGRLTGVLGTVAALIFALSLYSPYGDLHVASPQARESLNWMLLGGISLSFLFPRKYGLLSQRGGDGRSGE